MINLHENYVAGLGLELTTPGYTIRRTADCATEPGSKHLRCLNFYLGCFWYADRSRCWLVRWRFSTSLMIKWQITKQSLTARRKKKGTPELSHLMYTQWRLRSAWVPAQSDQSSLSTWRKLGSLAIHWAHSKDWSDWMQSFCWFCHEVAHLANRTAPSLFCHMRIIVVYLQFNILLRYHRAIWK